MLRYIQIKSARINRRIWVILIGSLFLSVIWSKTCFSQITVSGFVTDSTGQGIEFANLQIIAGRAYNVTSDSLGRFSQIIHKPGPVQIRAGFINYKPWESTFAITHDTTVIISLTANPKNINEVVVVSGKRSDNNTLLLSNKDFVLKSKGVGETDVLGYLQQKAGVVHSSEISPGIYVRGMEQGNTGIYYGGSELFGTSHMLSIYPQFNSDAINNARLLKADFDPRYGGYLSSFLLVEPDHQLYTKFSGKAETGILTTRLMVQCPVVKDKISVKLALRRSYFDLIAKSYNGSSDNSNDINKLSLYGFMDINGSLVWQTGKNVQFTLDVLSTADKIEFDDEIASLIARWKNQLVSGKLNISLSQKADLELLAGYTGFQFSADFMNLFNRVVKNSISQGNLFAKFNYKFSNNLRTETGADIKFNRLDLKSSTAAYTDEESTSIKWEVPSDNIALFGDIQWFATFNLKIKAGTRLELFHSDTAFVNLLPYLSANYDLNGYALNLSYSRQIQYKHLYVPTGINLPLNIWYPSQSDVPPAKASHFNISLNKNIFGKFNVSVSAYYIRITDLTEFVEGNYFSSPEFVTDKVGQGYSKGFETSFLLKIRKVEIEAGFTLSKSRRKFPSINNGALYSPSFDIRYKADLSILYSPGTRWTFTLNQFIQDGFVMTLPTSLYMAQTADLEGGTSFSPVPVYTTRYNFRMPLSHRMDISATYAFHWIRSDAGFTLGIYNVYNYQNPYFVYFVAETGDDQRTFLQAKKKSLIPMVPFASFKISF